MTIGFDKVRMEYGTQLALDDLTLTLASRELTVLVGPSGSGKSTLLRTVNHLVVPTSGSVTLDGQRVDSFRPEELRRGIGYGIQSVGLFPHHTVGRNIAAVPSLLKWSRSRIAARVEELLVLVGLDPARYRDRYPHELSGGEAQRVGVARALAADPPILLLDEPFSAVDPVTRLRLQGEFLSIQKTLHKTVVFVTHDVDEAIRLADKIVLLDQGRVVQYGTPEFLLDHPASPFAAKFLGADRALKRLSRMTVAEISVPAPQAVLEEVGLGPLEGLGRFVWIVDSGGKLLGNLDVSLLGPGVDPQVHMVPAAGDLAVSPQASLREALSIMVGAGVRSLAVTDQVGSLTGEVRLVDIERVGRHLSSGVEAAP